MALASGDDPWPSLAPIRTTPTISAPCIPASSSVIHTYIIDQTTREQTCSHGGSCTSGRDNILHGSAACTSEDDSPAPTTANTAAPGCLPSLSTSRPPSDSTTCSCTSRLSKLLPNCMTPSCSALRRPINYKQAWRSLAFLFPASGMQRSFYSSTPTAMKTPHSATFPRTFSGKAEHLLYASPRTPSSCTAGAAAAAADYRNAVQFSSPRTPATSKVQHFSGSIPSPRTPTSYGSAYSAAASPGSACARRRRKPRFALVMPPHLIMADKQSKSFHVQQQIVIDEPTSPHVTCMGRVRRQTQCKKLLHKDTFDPSCSVHRARQSIGKKKGANLMSCSSSNNRAVQAGNDLPAIDICRSNSDSSINIGSMLQASTDQQSTKEACTQRFGKGKLLHLHKIESHTKQHNIIETGDADEGSNIQLPHELAVDQMALSADNSQLSPSDHVSGTLQQYIVASHEYSIHTDQKETGQLAHVCMKSNGDINVGSNVQSNIDEACTIPTAAISWPNACCINEGADVHDHHDRVLQLHSRTCSDLESMSPGIEFGDDELQAEHHAPDHIDRPDSQRCLLLIRSTGSRRMSQADRISSLRNSMVGEEIIVGTK